ncbi:carboxymuconolactone decarboxylase family protein [uncultured Cycloclasticus sp.]|uniref:carboxymuconolactone decarboxylase family protein n=1 Tax=uncultured Cycloclasticus sp. TaxID=172194 RepID=UPI002588CF55|nr:carboxymuconolactone decarboxylase family protein [uncultured Cycloclasticus sp.]
MPRIKPLQNHELDAATSTTLDAVGKKLGMVPNLFATLAHAPAALNSYLGFSDNLSNGVLTAKQREIVALAVAQYNQCQYCLSAHSLMGKGAGLSENDIVKARNGSASEALNHTIAAFARDVVESRGVIPDEDFNAYAGQGLTHALMVEIIANVALNLLTNYINHLADTEIDFPVVDLVNQEVA